MEKDCKIVFTGIKQVQLQEEDIPALSDNQILVKTEVSQNSLFR